MVATNQSGVMLSRNSIELLADMRVALADWKKNNYYGPDRAAPVKPNSKGLDRQAVEPQQPEAERAASPEARDPSVDSKAKNGNRPGDKPQRLDVEHAASHEPCEEPVDEQDGAVVESWEATASDKSAEQHCETLEDTWGPVDSEKLAKQSEAENEKAIAQSFRLKPPPWAEPGDPKYGIPLGGSPPSPSWATKSDSPSSPPALSLSPGDAHKPESVEDDLLRKVSLSLRSDSSKADLRGCVVSSPLEAEQSSPETSGTTQQTRRKSSPTPDSKGNAPMSVEDVIAFHTKNGDLERQKRQYGPKYTETMSRFSKPSLRPHHTTRIIVRRIPVSAPAAPPTKPEPLSRKDPQPLQTFTTVTDRLNYPVPSLGSESMPKLAIKSFPAYRKWTDQIAETLPENLRNVPPPTYPFSQKPKVPAPDPAKLGITQAPARSGEAPQANPLDPASVRDAENEQQASGEGRTASEFGDEGLPPAATLVRHETATAASRWAWYARPELSVHGENFHALENRVIRQQLSPWDTRVTPDCWKYDDHGVMLWDAENIEAGKRKIKLVDEWMIRQFVNTLAQPYSWDTTAKAFVNGTLPCPGLSHDFQEFPADLAYEPVKIYYGPIDWRLVPCSKLKQNGYPEGKYFNQTSKSEMDRMMTQMAANVQENRDARKVREQISAGRREIRDLQINSIPSADTSKAIVEGNPHAVKGKIYIRAVDGRNDIQVMTRIFNYYVQSTIDTIECRKVRWDYFQSMIQRSCQEGYPVLVAVLRVDPGDTPVHSGLTGGLRPDGSDVPVETVVGFSLCRAWAGVSEQSALRDVATIQVYVSPQYLNRRIATNLLDRTIGCIDRDYQSKQGATICPPENHDLAWNEGFRPPQTIVMKWFFKDYTEPITQFRRDFLKDKFGFVETGQLINALSKDGHQTRYSMIMMQREANRFNLPPAPTVSAALVGNAPPYYNGRNGRGGRGGQNGRNRHQTGHGRGAPAPSVHESNTSQVNSFWR